MGAHANHPAVVCPLCAGSDAEVNVLPYPLFRHIDFFVFHPGPNRIARCPACGLVFRVVDDSEQQAIEAIYRSEEYVKHEEPHTLVLEGHDQPVPLARVQAGLLAPYLKAPAISVLDIGCFDGQLLLEIEKICDAADLCGFDVAARPQFPQGRPFRFVSGLLSEIEGSFDLITLSHSIQYVRDIHGLFENIRHLLKPDGRIFVQAPDFSVKPSSLLLGDLNYHYTREILGNIFRRMGFQAQFLDADCFPRDILAIAARGAAAEPVAATMQDDLRGGVQRIADLARRLEELASSAKVGVLGTTIDAAFVDQCLGPRVAFFVDENPRKVGTTFHGKPVVHPRSVATRDRVVIPMGAAGEAVRNRFAKQYPGSYRCA